MYTEGMSQEPIDAKTFSAKEAIDVIGQVNGFFKHCISEVRNITNLTRILQGRWRLLTANYPGLRGHPFYVEIHFRVD